MIYLEAMEHGVFWARLSGGSEGVLAVRCDPWEAMRVATMRERERQAKVRRAQQRIAGTVLGMYHIAQAAPRGPDRYGYLHRTDEEVGHIAHIEEE